MSRIERSIVAGTAALSFFSIAASSLNDYTVRNTRESRDFSGFNKRICYNGVPRVIVVIEPDINESSDIFDFLRSDIEDVAVVFHDRYCDLSWGNVFSESVDFHHAKVFDELIFEADERIGATVPIVFLCHGLGTEFTLRILSRSLNLRERPISIVSVSGTDGRMISSSRSAPGTVRRLLGVDQAIFSAIVGTSRFYHYPTLLPDSLVGSMRRLNSNRVAAIWARREWNSAVRGPFPTAVVRRVDAVIPQSSIGEKEELIDWAFYRTEGGIVRCRPISLSSQMFPFSDTGVSSRISAVVDEAADRT